MKTHKVQQIRPWLRDGKLCRLVAYAGLSLISALSLLIGPPAKAGPISGTEADRFLAHAYQVLVGRDADVTGLSYYGSYLTEGGCTYQVATSMVGSAEYMRVLANRIGLGSDPSGISGQ